MFFFKSTNSENKWLHKTTIIYGWPSIVEKVKIHTSLTAFLMLFQSILPLYKRKKVIDFKRKTCQQLFITKMKGDLF